MIKEIEADAKQHGDERRTLMQAEKRAVAEIKVVDEPVTVVVSLKGWVRALKGHEVDAGDAGLQGRRRAVRHASPAAASTRCWCSAATAASTASAVAALPGGRGDGQPITSLIDLEAGTQPAHYFAGAADTMLLLANTGGFGLLAQGRRHGGAPARRQELPERWTPASSCCRRWRWRRRTRRWPACRSSGRLLVFPLDELKRQPNGGTRPDADGRRRQGPAAVGGHLRRHAQVLGSGRGGKAKDEVLRGAALAAHDGKRARKGRKVEGLVKVLRCWCIVCAARQDCAHCRAIRLGAICMHRGVVWIAGSAGLGLASSCRRSQAQAAAARCS